MRIGMLVICSAAIVFGHSYPVAGYNGLAAGEAQHQSAVMIDDKIIQKQTAAATIDIRIPVISGLTDIAFQTKLNEAIQKQALAEKTKIMKAAKGEMKQAKQEGRRFVPYNLTMQYKVKNKADILSFYVTTYEFTGGAHGMTGTDYYNIDTNQNKRLSLADLFKHGSNYKEVINAEISKQIAGQEAAGDASYFHPDDAYVGDSVFQSIKEDQPFYIEDGDLVITFAQYEIAPGYMGQPAFFISLKSLEKLIEEKYQSLIV